MSADWSVMTLGDVCLKITDGAHNSPKSVAAGKPMASVKDLTRFGVDLTGARHISVNDYEGLVRQGCRPEVGDVLIAKDGNSALDTVCNIKQPLDAVLLSSVAILRPDPTVVDSDFLKFFLSSKETIDYLKSHFISGAAIPRVVLKDFKKASIKLPPLDIQKAIVAILNSVEGKIQLNRQINQTLEQIAQAIFKSWFVDFEPVKAKIEAKAAGRDPERAAMCAISGKLEPELDQLPPDQYQQLAATAALFPDEMVESVLGLIPGGWEVGTLADLCLLNAKSWGTKTIPSRVHYVDLANTKNGEILDVRIFSAEDAPSRARRVLRTGDTIIGTVRPGNRSFAFIGSLGPTLTGSTGFAVLSPKSDKLREIVYILATDGSNIDRLARLADGAAYPAVRPEVVVEEQCVIPSDELVNGFHQIVGPIFDQRLANGGACETLATLRDTLLPKLLSGELSVGSQEVASAMETAG